MNRTQYAAAILLSSLVCLLVGCGSSGGSGPLTKAEFVKQGTEICKEAAQQRDEDLKAAVEESGKGDGRPFAEYVDIALESVEDMVGDLSDLEPPAGQRKATEALVEDLAREVEAVKASPDNPVTTSSFKAANETARQAGLPACTV